MRNLVAVAYPDVRISQFGGELVQTELGPEREAELPEALAG
jgi:hypothetical protein